MEKVHQERGCEPLGIKSARSPHPRYLLVTKSRQPLHYRIDSTDYHRQLLCVAFEGLDESLRNKGRIQGNDQSLRCYTPMMEDRQIRAICIHCAAINNFPLNRIPVRVLPIHFKWRIAMKCDDRLCRPECHAEIRRETASTERYATEWQARSVRHVRCGYTGAIIDECCGFQFLLYRIVVVVSAH